MKRAEQKKVIVSRTRRQFSDAFKAEAVRMMQERRAGVSVAHIARELAVTAEQLRVWARAQRDASAETGRLPGETLEQELRRLRRENETLRQEQAFAKKVAVYFAKESR